MNRFGIIGAMEVEIALLTEKMTEKKITKIAQQTYTSGQLQGQPVVVTCSGIGKVNAAVTAQILISNFQVTHLINTGIAGNLSRSLTIGDVVLSDSITYHDFDLDFLARYAPFTRNFKADATLKKAFSSILSDFAKADSFSAVTGFILTGDVFLNSYQQKESIIARFASDHPLCIEMEGAAIAHTASKHGIPFVVLRCISDSAEDNADTLYDAFFEEMANRCASIVLQFLETVSK